MAPWIDVNDDLPEEAEPVTVRVKGTERADYYRIEDRWYSLEDLDRWQMKTSRYWAEDRSWYLKTEQIERWKGTPRDPQKKTNTDRTPDVGC